MSKQHSSFRNALALIAAASLLLGALQTLRAQNDSSGSWISLFNGENLDGWTKLGGNATYAVEDGAIVGTTAPNTPNTFLCTDRGFSDFELEFEVKIDPKLNSGVQFRSQSRPDYKNGQVHGYQLEIDPSPRAFTGGVYDEGRRGWLADLKTSETARQAFRQNEWNKLRLVTDGAHTQTWVNGVPAVTLRDDMTSSGFIGLQVHSVETSEPLQVRWRNLRLREL